MAHTFNPSTQKAEAAGSTASSRTAKVYTKKPDLKKLIKQNNTIITKEQKLSLLTCLLTMRQTNEAALKHKV